MEKIVEITQFKKQFFPKDCVISFSVSTMSQKSTETSSVFTDGVSEQVQPRAASKIQNPDVQTEV